MGPAASNACYMFLTENFNSGPTENLKSTSNARFWSSSSWCSGERRVDEAQARPFQHSWREKCGEALMRLSRHGLLASRFGFHQISSLIKSRKLPRSINFALCFGFGGRSLYKTAALKGPLLRELSARTE
ncbi:hypothetical protein QQF64_020683 [Cirrhinus molitorella]|uniref:Uncharacterized protein n=1 Tax=Cirrhinus molitorella TaxID=172907 RepID=A0ABR3LDS6_9TELE